MLISDRRIVQQKYRKKVLNTLAIIAPRGATPFLISVLLVCSCGGGGDPDATPAARETASETPLHDALDKSGLGEPESKHVVQLTPAGDEVLAQLMRYGESYESRMDMINQLRTAATDEASPEALQILNAYVWKCTFEDVVLVEALWILAEVGDDGSEAAILQLLAGESGPQAPWSSRALLAAGYALEAIRQRQESGQYSSQKK